MRPVNLFVSLLPTRPPVCLAPCHCGKALTYRGQRLQLVLIDRLPFPRPDDPLASARQRYVESHGGNGFMSVAATQASLRIAQGAGRLIRDATDRGVVAVLDSRLEKARYGGFVRASLPPMWPTTDGALVRASLRKIDQTAPDPLPVAASPLAAAAGGPGTRHGKRWTKEEEASLRERFVAGTPLIVLAEELGSHQGRGGVSHAVAGVVGDGRHHRHQRLG